MEPKVEVKSESKAAAREKPRYRQHHYEEPTYDTVVEPEIDMEAVKSSIQLISEESDNNFMTVEQLRQSKSSFDRGAPPIEASKHEEIIGSVLKGDGFGKISAQAPAEIKPQSQVRATKRLKR